MIEELFSFVNDELIIQPEAKSIPRFKPLFKNKNYKDYFKYLYFLYKYNSPYMAYPEQTRPERCKKDYIPKLPLIDELKDAAAQFNEFQDTVSYRLFTAAKNGCEKLIEYCNVVDLNERGNDKKPIHSAKMLADTLKQVAGIKQSLEELEKAMKRDMVMGKTKGNKFISEREG